jgi:hypothetical protein
VVQQPGAGHDNGDPADLGVVAIPDSIVPPGIIPATLPAAGALATQRHGDLLTLPHRRFAGPPFCARRSHPNRRSGLR